jgi:hypothetical protein
VVRAAVAIKGGGQMDPRGCKARAWVQLSIGAFTLLALAGTGVAEERDQLAVVTGTPPGACKNLGKVTGMTQRSPLDETGAMKDALKQARDLGATHFRYYPEYSGQRGSNTWIYFGVAYRCQAPATPPPGGSK